MSSHFQVPVKNAWQRHFAATAADEMVIYIHIHASKDDNSSNRKVQTQSGSHCTVSVVSDEMTSSSAHPHSRVAHQQQHHVKTSIFKTINEIYP